jgi:squalene-hopene/tetraprenyl-beta-curcumene cyclase
MSSKQDLVDRTIDALTARLLEHRTSAGHWEGRLSSSALSTAVATVALSLTPRPRMDFVRAGQEWLIANQNADGGWGDTVSSASNLGTTLLCWAALAPVGAVVDRPGPHKGPLKAEQWLREQIGDLTPDNLKLKIVERYGKDRTFSVPILSVLALTGRLEWRLVPQLPFELAAFPHELFRWLRLPVVSYALPALIAIGQSRHNHAPSRNPLFSAIRSSLRPRTLQIAREMQPDSGGYLEAAPLTAFVAMNLISSGSAGDSIVANAVRFLEESARPDGSWPIDTNLATWVTTLSVNALGTDTIPAEHRDHILQWLLAQQVSKEHPFTHAMPGGWAWTDRSGGVPDADDTSGALIALWKLGGTKRLEAALSGINWLLALQNGDGGIPTFCRGWGALPFDRSAPDLTAHTLEAWGVWYNALPPDLQRKVSVGAEHAVSYLSRRQHVDGSWTPLWFGNQHAPGEMNPTYGTARVIAALAVPLVLQSPVTERIRRRGLAWLLNSQNRNGGWGGAQDVTSSIEETGLALHALGTTASLDMSDALAEGIERGAKWLIDTTRQGTHTPASPIGLYFARLWYHEELYPILFALQGLSRTRALLRLRW